MENRLNGKIAVVTGGAKGIGRAIAERLAADGATLVIADLQDAEQAAAEMRAGGASATGVAVDVSNERDTAALADTVKRQHGHAHILINNAGIFSSLQWTPFDKIPLTDWERLYRVNVFGTMLCTRAIVPLMEAAGGGRVVNIGSATALKGSPYMLHYVSSKGAILSMTRALAAELGPRNIRVNCVAPGYTMSDGVLENREQREFSFGGIPAAEFVRNHRVIQRDQLPADVSGIVAFLVGAEADFLTGQTIVADGGMFFH